jgi:hypothetical protein
LDPCCGAGDPLKRIAEHSHAESYGIEIDQLRASVSKEKLSHVLRADALTVRISPGAFSLLFLNPPYDHDEKSRLEHRFLVHATAWLMPRGVLIYIIPQGRYHDNTVRYLASWYEGVRLYRFPKKEHWRFKQTVLFGVKKPRASLDPSLAEKMRSMVQREMEELPAEGDPLFTLPNAPISENLLFRSNEVSPEEALPEVEDHGVWQLPEVRESLSPDRTSPFVQPLMPLRQGHLAQLIAAGFINNRVLVKGKKRLLIKGRTEKSVIERPGEDESTLIEREVIRTTIMALDEKGNLIEIGESQ